MVAVELPPSQGEKQSGKENVESEERTLTKKAQKSLTAFFGQPAVVTQSGVKPKEGSPVILRGPGATLEDFPEGKVDLWSWNVNGVNACIHKGDLTEFMTKN